MKFLKRKVLIETFAERMFAKKNMQKYIKPYFGNNIQVIWISLILLYNRDSTQPYCRNGCGHVMMCWYELHFLRCQADHTTHTRAPLVHKKRKKKSLTKSQREESSKIHRIICKERYPSLPKLFLLFPLECDVRQFINSSKEEMKRKRIGD